MGVFLGNANPWGVEKCAGSGHAGCCVVRALFGPAFDGLQSIGRPLDGILFSLDGIFTRNDCPVASHNSLIASHDNPITGFHRSVAGQDDLVALLFNREPFSIT